MPSCTAPTMAMAPMDTVMVAVINPSRNRASLPFPLFSRSQRPKPSSLPSRSSSSPARPPSATDITSISVPCEVRLPFSMTNISPSTPAMATNSTHTAIPRISVSWVRSLSHFPPTRPMPPPITMASTLMMVPVPIISFASFSPYHSEHSEESPPAGRRSFAFAALRSG